MSLICAKAAIVVADSAYVGLYKDLPDHSVLVPHKALRGHPLLPDHKLANRELAAIRIRVENVVAQLKIFRILSHRFRHTVAVVHTQVFSIIAALYNWRTLNRLTQARKCAQSHWQKVETLPTSMAVHTQFSAFQRSFAY